MREAKADAEVVFEAMEQFAPYDGKDVVLSSARRLWYWAGAASLSQLAVSGTTNPTACKFPVAVPSVTLTEAIEIIPVSDKAEKILTDMLAHK